MRRLEIRRHSFKGRELGGDALSAEGVAYAVEIGGLLRGGYTHLFTSGAQRATQTLAALLAGLGQRVPHGPCVRTELLSPVEDRWRAAARAAGSGALEAIRSVDADLVAKESARLAAAFRAILAELPDGGYGLAVGHSPLTECGIYGLTGRPVVPLRECEGFLLLEQDGGLEVVELRLPPG